jgi:hypothetical protein
MLLSWPWMIRHPSATLFSNLVGQFAHTLPEIYTELPVATLSEERRTFFSKVES